MDNNCMETEGLSKCLIETMLLQTKALMTKIQTINETKVENIVRSNIVPPIKGKICKSKLRWRGIRNILYGLDGIVIGFVQRGKVIGENGTLGVFENGIYKPY